MDIPDLKNKKADARTAMKDKRKALFSRLKQDDHKAGLLAHDRTLVSGFKLACAAAKLTSSVEETRLAGYAAIQTELSIWKFMSHIEVDGFALCLPVVEGPDRPLAFHTWQSSEPLVKGAFGAPIPHVASAPKCVPDLMLVPLLGFDARGYRLGYGGGFYDRSIALYKPKLVLGVGFAGQEMPSVPTGSYDLPLDGILTEQGLRYFDLERRSQMTHK